MHRSRLVREPRTHRETEPATTSPLRWPGAWLRSEAWWRDVSSRAAAGLVVVLVTYLAAAAGGLVQRPEISGVVIFAAGLGVLGFATYGLGRLLAVLLNRFVRSFRVKMVLAFLSAPLVTGGALLLAYLVADLVDGWLSSAP